MLLHKILKILFQSLLVILSFVFCGILYCAAFYIYDWIENGKQSPDAWWGLVWQVSFPVGGIAGVILMLAFLYRKNGPITGMICIYGGVGLALLNFLFFSDIHPPLILVLLPPLFVIASSLLFPIKK